jgi:glycosyltransferase involved in cell wall biosynthesis
MSTPQVTVVLPVYNAEAHLAAAVESVLSQTFADFEVLAINDGSTDGSGAILTRYAAANPRLRVIDQPNRGLIEVLNRGVREARGRWVARMDADDVCLPRRLERQVAHLAAHPDVALLGGWVATIDEAGRLLADVVPFPVTHDECGRRSAAGRGSCATRPSSSAGMRPWTSGCTTRRTSTPRTPSSSPG